MKQLLLLSLLCLASCSNLQINEEPEDMYEELVRSKLATYEVGPADHESRDLLIQVGQYLTCGAHYENTQLSNIICKKGMDAAQCATQPLTCQKSELRLPVDPRRSFTVFLSPGDVVDIADGKIRCIARSKDSVLCMAGSDNFIIR